MIIALSITCVVLLSVLAVSVYFNIKHGLLILKLQDSLEAGLDILDERYRKISEILEIPIFFDSVEVRQVLEEIKKSRDALLFIGNLLIQLERDEEEIND